VICDFSRLISPAASVFPLTTAFHKLRPKTRGVPGAAGEKQHGLPLHPSDQASLFAAGPEGICVGGAGWIRVGDGVASQREAQASADSGDVFRRALATTGREGGFGKTVSALACGLAVGVVEWGGCGHWLAPWG